MAGNGSRQSAAVKRILLEVQELHREQESVDSKSAESRLFYAAPLENDLFEWHFTVRGPPDTCFEGGLYHGRILLPSEYPLKPPEFMLLTPNGRFEVGKRICLSITSFHQETWQPSWGIRTMLTALIGFMPSAPEGIGALDYPDVERALLAKLSHSFHCSICGANVADDLPPLQNTKTNENASADSSVDATNETQTVTTNQTTESDAVTSWPSPAASNSSVILERNGIDEKTSHETSHTTKANGDLAANQRTNSVVQSGSIETQANAGRAGINASPVQAKNRSTRVAGDSELKYIAYSILVLIFGILLRRMYLSLF
mmetsp:Transcript_12349/g.22315  ORF Transcript_12349/g.22315 Transcript_12349/m.22315 type:complete len:316 (+) Transcript_12349:47-994(+)